MERFRAAVIGAGSRAMSVIYPSLAALPDVEIAAVCDIDPGTLAAAADRWAIPRRYGETVLSYRDMIDEVKPDGVFAIGPPHLFYDIWTWCLAHGQNLYVEKPLGLTAHQAQSLAWLAQQNRCITAVSFQRRTTPMVVRMREACLARGHITHALCRFYKWDPAPRTDARDHMMDDCVHAIDTLRWVCGGEIEEIHSRVRRVGTPDINFIQATLYFDNGAVGCLLNSWTSGKRIFSVEMHGPGIYAEAEHEVGGCLYADGDLTGVAYTPQVSAGSDEFAAYTGVTALCREFVDGCRGGALPQTHFGDAVKTMEAADTILAQALLAGR